MTDAIRTLPLSAVDIRDDFWTPRLETNRLVTLEHQYDHIKANGCLDNFRRVLGEAGGEFEGPMFVDANAYKWLEAASYVLATEEMPSLRRKVDEVVSLIERTQAEDGYLCTFFMLADQEDRWTNFSRMHELYCAGHLIEAGIAHHRSTGETTLLDVARQFADHIDERFGPGQREIIPGHEEIELALVELFRATGERRYLDLSTCFIDRRGRDPSPLATEFSREWELGSTEDYDEVLQSIEANRDVFLDESGTYDGRFAQDHAPVREQESVEGHAVRATYLYTAVAALLREIADPELFDAVERLWESMVRKRMYVTGGIGSTSEGEALTTDYDLPNETAYAETCAAIGSVRWSQKMFELTGEAKYIDVLERALYNGSLVGVSLDGTRFSYSNPLETQGTYERKEWLYVACCPPNLARTLASLGQHVYAQDADSIYVNLYVGSDIETTVSDHPVRLSQRTEYPWQGDVDVEVSLQAPTEFEVKFRIPDWADGYEMTVNGRSIAADAVDGYAAVRRTFEDGDEISLTFPMTIDVLAAHPDVRADEGHVALQRGPLVYCVESVDNAVPVHHLILGDPESLTASHDESLLEGVTVIEGTATVQRLDEWDDALYRPIDAVGTDQTTVTAIPYYAWNNREQGAMRVWLRLA
ncbi:glycoside hydrolase family 127 protein [Halosimplex amylolyticum]|uniref:glycoside hydrolase family 127 protein n=1 Tax=Halosimplex amylolyticum TaxID=3396616 RepID=UPI003F545A9B